jgi:16S rRNA (guanine527-N7)-methyltransferase
MKQALFSSERLTSQQERALTEFIELLNRWRLVTNLVSRSDARYLWTRHVADCLSLLSFAPNARRWLDIGSGAGFPSVVIAIQLSGIRNALVHAVESDSRKCVFLREVARQLHLPMRIHNQRAESIAPSEILPIDAVTARAFAAIPQIMQIAKPFLTRGATVVLPRGKGSCDLDELDGSCYSFREVSSPLAGGGTIVLVSQRNTSDPL